MANYSDIFPLSGGGGNEGIINITSNTSISTDGIYRSTEVDHLIIDIGSLPTGSHLIWLNEGIGSVVFSGLATIGAQTITSNKGAHLASSESLWLKKTGSSTAFIIHGDVFINWIPGLEPSVLTFEYASPGDTNGMIYYLGATKHNESFVNPATRGEINVTESAVASFAPTWTGAKCFDRDIQYQTDAIWYADNQAPGWVRIAFNNGLSARVTAFEVASSNFHALSSFMGENCLLQASNNGTTWTDILTFFPNVGVSQRYYSGAFANPTFYPYYRFYTPRTGDKAIGEIELYGELQ